MPLGGPVPPGAATDLLGAMAEVAPCAMIVVSACDLRVVALNRAARSAARRDGAAVVGATLAEAFPILDRPDLCAWVAASLSPRPSTARLRVDSPTRHWEVAAVKIPPQAGGAEPMVLLTAWDVPPQQAGTPAGPPVGGGELQAFLAQLPAAIFIIEHPDGRITFESRLVDEVLRHPSHDLDDARARLSGWAVHPDGRPYDLAEYPSRRALFDGETVQAEPMIYYAGDSRRIDLEIYAGPMRDDGGTIVAAAVAAFDVTARRQAEALLRENEERLRLAVEAGGLGTWEVDLTRQVVRFGAEFAAMLGQPPGPLVADRATAALHVHPDDIEAVQRAFRQAMAEGTQFRSEYRGRATDGSTRWFVGHGRFLRDAAGTPVRAVGVVRDITSRREREDRLREMIEAREMLLREADHRIKNSLQLVASLLGLQRARLADPDAIAALDNAIMRVMAVGQAHKALHQSADLRHVDFHAMLRDLCAHVGTLNPALDFTCDCPPGFLLDTARAIPLGLIVSELLTNAAKHAYPEGAGVIRTRVAVEPQMLRIEVADDGIGLPPDARRRAGLGSSIVRSLAAQVGVAVELATPPGGGTRAILRGPLQPPNDL